MSEFTRFPSVTLSFLKGIAAHNDKPWFDAHRSDYEAGYVDAGRRFVEVVGDQLRSISPEVQFAPRINGSIMRINRDIRFSNDKSPYKTHLDLWFWHGEKKGWSAPGFYLRITPEIIYLGTGMHAFDKPWLTAFRDAVVDEARGKKLAGAIAQVEEAGPYEIGGTTRKRVPQGYPADHARAPLLLHEGLYAGVELPSQAALEPGFTAICLEHFGATWPISRWLLDEVGPKVVRD